MENILYDVKNVKEILPRVAFHTLGCKLNFSETKPSPISLIANIESIIPINNEPVSPINNLAGGKLYFKNANKDPIKEKAIIAIS